MSDVGIADGLGIFLGACVTLFMGAAFALIGAIAAYLQRQVPGELPLRRARRYLAGPALCLAIGVFAFLLMWIAGLTPPPSRGGHSMLETLDDIWFLFPLAGFVGGIVVSILFARPRRPTRWGFGPNGVARWRR